MWVFRVIWNVVAEKILYDPLYSTAQSGVLNHHRTVPLARADVDKRLVGDLASRRIPIRTPDISLLAIIFQQYSLTVGM
jgi:hypothetical protein